MWFVIYVLPIYDFCCNYRESELPEHAKGNFDGGNGSKGEGGDKETGNDSGGNLKDGGKDNGNTNMDTGTSS